MTWRSLDPNVRVSWFRGVRVVCACGVCVRVRVEGWARVLVCRVCTHLEGWAWGCSPIAEVPVLTELASAWHPLKVQAWSEGGGGVPQQSRQRP